MPWTAVAGKDTLAVKLENRPILNGEYYDFWMKSEPRAMLPAMWVEDGDDIKVRRWQLRLMIQY